MRQFLLPSRFAGEPRITLSGKDFHYLTRVLRKREGDEVAAVTTDGARYTMRIEKVGRSSCRIMLNPAAPGSPDGEAGGMPASVTQPRVEVPALVLLQCLPKGRKMDLIVRQAVEAGVSRIIPLLSERTVALPEDSAGRLARWRRIAREALQQSGNARLTDIQEPMPVSRIEKLDRESEGGLFFHQEKIGEGSLHRALRVMEGARRISLLIGPEGGLSPAETRRLQDAGFTPVFFGDAVLRTETAAIYAIAAVNTLLREGETWTLAE
jgi:16S rRNA (uracil1498-N3)-methyltransferase